MLRSLKELPPRWRALTSKLWLVVAALVLMTRGVHAQEAPDAARSDPILLAMDRLAMGIQRTTLKNGLRVVMHTDPSSPTVAVSVTYDVGSRNEREGQSGFAHLFEHMMFQGSRHLKKGEHFSLIAERGGTLNGTTSADRTNYFELLPASELELALFLEADRLRWLDVSRENFENQRAVVQEEYRMRVENTPYTRGVLRLGELVFRDYAPYAHPTIGKMEDLAAAKLEWVQEFYAQNYAPNNAVLTIAGDFDPAHALELVRKHFGPAERRDLIPFDGAAAPPPEAGSAPRETLRDVNASTPALLFGYRIPPFRSEEHYALELAAMLLADGESSRLYSALVRERALLQSVSAWTDDHRGPDQLTLLGVLTEGAELSAAERAFANAIERLRQSKAGASELERVKNRIRHDFAFELQSNARRAIQLGEYELMYGDARLLSAELGKYLAVTAEDVRRAASRYLVPERRVVVEIHPVAREARR